jgi:SWI/SNF-related matrix-associated actin-dependent regulator 1 of chromatin subfamily A
MIRRLKKDVLPDLPKKIRGMLTLDIDNQSEYDVAMLGFSDWLKGGKAKNRMEGIAKLEYARQAAVKGKMKQITEWIENFLESGQKLVLFGVHREPLINLHKKFHNSVLINGDTSAVEKQRAVDRLQNDSKTNLLLGNIQAAGVGLTLTAASNVAFIELPWVPALVIQAEDRCNRIGSVYCTNIYYLLAKNTIEEQLFDIINMKQKLVDRIIDGVDTMEETSVFDEMVSLYSK